MRIDLLRAQLILLIPRGILKQDCEQLHAKSLSGLSSCSPSRALATLPLIAVTLGSSPRPLSVLYVAAHLSLGGSRDHSLPTSPPHSAQHI